MHEHARVTAPRFPLSNPYRSKVGWCHNCEQLQWGADARYMELWWSRGDFDWCCISCDGEPWGLGVWVRGDVSAIAEGSPLAQKIHDGRSLYDLDEHERYLLDPDR